MCIKQVGRYALAQASMLADIFETNFATITYQKGTLNGNCTTRSGHWKARALFMNSHHKWTF
jgi:hypothetical protein